MARVNLSKALPDLYQKIGELDQGVTQALKRARIPEGFSHLLKLRASQINGCDFCIKIHSQDAFNGGESLDRISLLAAWRETEEFSPFEKAALNLVETITEIAVGQIPDSIYQQANEVLNDEQIAAIEWAAIVINSWNRIAIASRYPV